MLKICFLNIENLFVHLDSPFPRPLSDMNEVEWQSLAYANQSNKPLSKCREIAHTINKIEPDILALAEVGGLESLEYFNELFLGEKYKPYLLEGNSDRGIDVGYLVKTKLNLRVEIWTHKDHPVRLEGGKKTRFSRDVGELRLYQQNNQTQVPDFIFFLVHLKSKLDPLGKDPMGRQRRKAELQALVDIYNDSRKSWPQPVPSLLMGDFNGNASPNSTGDEFKAIYDSTDLQDVFEWAGLDKSERTTQVQFLPGGYQQKLQLDYFFASPDMLKLIEKKSATVAPFYSANNEVIPLPTTLAERLQLPSDHFPIHLDFKISNSST